MEIPTEEYLVPIGKAKVLLEGSDITIVSYSNVLKVCEKAVKELRGKGIKAELIDLRTIKPLDIATVVASIRKTNHGVLVEEGHLYGGITAELAFQIQEHCFDYLDAPIERVCQMETPMPYSKMLEKETLPSVERILKSVYKSLNRSF